MIHGVVGMPTWAQDTMPDWSEKKPAWENVYEKMASILARKETVVCLEDSDLQYLETLKLELL